MCQVKEKEIINFTDTLYYMFQINNLYNVYPEYIFTVSSFLWQRLPASAKLS